ncbi:MAG: hydroxymethylglutaryl-CoA synthase family protein [Chloroflexota bacterium]|nr:MAG: hydroxymethylglutaryl-CoA synthase family protein [Chloroflexota bacterium]
MVGILSYGAFIPRHRLARDLIAQAWGRNSMGGEKAVANFDEDSISMAVEAGLDCLHDVDPKQIDGLFFASTTAPYKEKHSSSLIATALDFRKDILTSDFSGSLRSGANALRAAIDAIQGKSAKQILVVVADCRLAPGGSDLEQILGDGAAAFLLGDAADSSVVAEIIGGYSVSDEFTDYWRTDQDAFVRSWEDRFAITGGYTTSIQEAVKGIMSRHDLGAGAFSKLVLDAPNSRQQANMAKALSFDFKRQLSDLLYSMVGNTGTALAPMMLAEALEKANQGDKILFASYGDGCQAFIFEVTQNMGMLGERRGIKLNLASKTQIGTYEKYLSVRKLVDKEEIGPLGSSSAPALWRDRRSFLSFYGSKCKNCSLIQHPVQRVCLNCQSVDNYDEVKLAKTGTVYTYAESYVAESPEVPTVFGVTILDDGCRVWGELVETEPQKKLDRPQKIGMPVEATFRKMNDASGFHNYYWKVRPVRR